MIQVTPIFCSGYCRLENISLFSESEPPKQVTCIDVSSPKEARELGWTSTRYKMFTPDGREAWLCPECSKQWNEERQMRIDRLLEIWPNPDPKQFQSLRNELFALDATKEEADRLDRIWSPYQSPEVRQAFDNVYREVDKLQQEFNQRERAKR